MDTASTFIGIALFLLFIAPVAYLLMSEGLHKRKQKKHFLMASKEYNLNFTEMEFLSDLSLGLDEISKKLFVFIVGKTPKTFCIDLNDITSSEVLSSYSKPSRIKNAIDDISEITLNLKSKIPVLEENKIPFFGGNFQSVLQKEARMNSALKWNQLIQKTLAR